MKKGLRVLSLFDGISCGQLALQRAGLPVEIYFASEIDKHAIKITQKNYPETIQMGDVKNIYFESLGQIDLLIGGSPCQGFSFAGKQLNFNDPRSKLFFEYVRALEEIQPKYFLLENVKMKQEFQNIITSHLGVEPIEINSSLISAQNRKRLYWTNIPNVSLPENRNIILKDIVHEINVDFYLYNRKEKLKTQIEKSKPLLFSDARGLNRNQDQTAIVKWLEEFIVLIDENFHIIPKETPKGKVGWFRQDSQANRVYYLNSKAVTLCGEAGGGAAKMGQYLFGDVINKGKDFVVRGYIRRLTPIECERLQTLPDNYTEGISNAQRYKCLGNGWTVDVIAHIFKFLKQELEKGEKNEW